jgi:hypothetical protein
MPDTSAEVGRKPDRSADVIVAARGVTLSQDRERQGQRISCVPHRCQVAAPARRHPAIAEAAGFYCCGLRWIFFFPGILKNSWGWTGWVAPTPPPAGAMAARLASMAWGRFGLCSFQVIGFGLMSVSWNFAPTTGVVAKYLGRAREGSWERRKVLGRTDEVTE